MYSFSFNECLKISSYNCKNVKSSLPEVRKLCDISDIVFLQETWLASDELPLLASLDDRFYGQGVSAMDAGDSVLCGRPHGGLGILWRKSMKGCIVSSLPNPRILSIQIDTEQHCMNIFNVYMPCDNPDNHDEFLELLSHLSTAVEESEALHIAMIGDFNANISPGTHTLFGNELRRFCIEESLTISDDKLCPPSTFTFFSEAHQSVSWLDHCVCNANLHSAVKDISVLYDYITSDHMPVLLTFDLGKATIDLDRTDEEPSVRKIKWNKLSKEDLYQYHELTEHHLNGVRLNHELLLCDDTNCQFQAHQHSVDAMYNSIIQALKISGKEFTQERECSKRYNIIPGWNEYCREVHSNARDAFITWAMNGRPRSGPLHRNMQITRATFKQALRRCKASESKAHADSLARKLLMKDTKSFWAEIKRLNGKSSAPIASTIGNCTGPNAIAEQWKNHYSSILNSVPPGRHYKGITEFLESTTYYKETLSAIGVKNATADLKLGKASGLDTLSAEHFRYASNRISVLLSLCFNAMLIHSYVPKAFSDTVLVPIIKNKKGDITDIDNYRPIAITSVASKVFEKIILSRIQDSLYTNDNQFSYKVKHSTEMCIFTLKSIVDYYISSSSPVYLCYIDASKAFDRINYWNLFHRLIDRNVPVILVRFFMAWYRTQEFVVRWGKCCSTTFTTSNGVRQGGILSPLFFNVYMDKLSCTLNDAKAGCIMNGVYMNHLMYADDLVLIAPSVRALQVLLGYCDSFAQDNDAKYNTKKTECMLVRPKEFKSDFIPCFELAGFKLKCASTNKYLGVHIATDQKDDRSIGQQCRNIYSRGNTIIRNFKHCSDAVKCQLFKSFCTSFYCASLWSSYTIESLVT